MSLKAWKNKVVMSMRKVLTGEVMISEQPIRREKKA